MTVLRARSAAIGRISSASRTPFLVVTSVMHFYAMRPAKHRIDPRAHAARRNFEHFADERVTSFQLPDGLRLPGTSMPAIFACLSKDEKRNTLIVDDVLASLESGRNPLVLTERRDHLEYFAARFKGAARNGISWCCEAG